MTRTIHVYEQWSGDGPVHMGCLYADSLRGKETCSFEYSREWLDHHAAPCMLDPDLALFQGRQYVPMDKQLFGIFSDSCPDRWGRLLMRRREAILAHREDRKPRQLTETDYLLGVHDEARLGALRFATEKDGPFLSADSEMAAPPWVYLRELEAASRAYEKEEDTLDDRWLKILLAPGSSLGGARPKASVRAADGSLWIAKFPSRHDETDTGAWEQTVHELARTCGLTVPESRLERFSEAGSTFLVRRFDRRGTDRIHFASAMALLGRTDGSEGAGYLELADFLTAHGADPQTDLAELWKRIVFSMAVSNTDDHLRNHGFLLTKTGWRLSPMFDVNPVPYGDTLSMNVIADDARIDPEVALEAARFFGLKTDEAKEELQRIFSLVRRDWRAAASECGLSRPAIRSMEPAFRLAEKGSQ